MKFSSLLIKTLLGIVLLFGVISAITSFSSARIIRNYLTAEYKSKALAISNSISTTIPDALLNMDASAIQSIIYQYLDIEGVAYVYVYDQTGQMVAHTFVPIVPKDLQNNMRVRQTSSKTQITEFKDQGQLFLDISTPILNGKAGFVHIGMNLKQIESYIWEAIFEIQAVTLAMFFLCVIVVYFIIKRITTPIARISDYARKITNHNFQASLDIKRNDEIGDLATRMRGMGSELNRLINNLEESIAESTAELQETLIYHSVVLSNIADGLIVVDQNQEITQFNPAMAQVMGLQASQIATLSLSDLIGKVSADKLVPPQTAGNPPRSFPAGNMEIEFKPPGKREPRYLDISYAWVDLNYGPSTILIFRDTTARKKVEQKLHEAHQDLETKIHARTRDLLLANDKLTHEIRIRQTAEEALAAEKELFAVTLRSIDEGVLTTDNRSRILYINRTAEIILDCSQKKACESKFSDIFKLISKEDNFTFSDPMLEVRRGSIHDSEKTGILATPQGSNIDISLKLSPILDRDSKIIGTVLVFRDITDWKKEEESRIRSEKLKSIGVLAGGIAHDFNNIMTAVLNNIILFKSQQKDSSIASQKLNRAEKGILRAQQLTQQLLTFSKGGAPIKKATDLQNLINETAEFAIRGTNIVTKFNFQNNLWDAEIDPGQISQVIENLVINACQAMPAGGAIEIQVNNFIQDPGASLPIDPGKYLRIRFADDGIGIPASNLERIFDPYFSTKSNGSGLGLATAYSIIKRHNGYIEVKSRKNWGTSFYIYLPATDTELIPDLKTNFIQKDIQARILIMDDEEEITAIISEALELYNHQVCVCSSGKEAIRLYKEYKQKGQGFDVLIMDLTIPGGMGGQETIAELIKFDPSVTSIVSSGYSQSPVMANYKDYGFKGVLAKPYTIDDLRTRISQVMAK